MTSEPPDFPAEPIDASPAHGAILRRLGRNASWIMGGRGVSGLISLAYLALAARAMGPHMFGTFSLILSYAGGLAALIQFQTGYAVIRFGAIHVASGRDDRLAQLLGSLAVLDVCAAVLGAGIAILAVPLVGPWLGWTAQEQHGATIFSAVLLLTTGATATGMLRLFDRFDLLAYAETVGPAIRLIGALILWFTGASLNGFLAAWALALIGESGAGWIAAIAIRRSRLSVGRGALAAIRRDNERIVPFLLHNNLRGTLDLVWQYAGIMMVGGLVGASAAGGFRIASKLAAAIGKPIESITRALYPEFARLAAGGDRRTIMAVVRRISLAALAIDIALLAVVALFGRDILLVLYGRAFEFATPFLLLLTVAAAVDLSCVAFESVLNANGYSGRTLIAHAFGAAVHLGSLVWLVPAIGAVGAGVSAIAGMIALRGMTAIFAIRMLRRTARS